MYLYESNLLYICTEYNINSQKVRCTCFYVSSSNFAFPHALDPLANSLKSTNVLEERVNAWGFECELNYVFHASIDWATGLVALEVLVILLLIQIKLVNNLATYPSVELVCSVLLHLNVLHLAVAYEDLPDSVLLLQVRVVLYLKSVFVTQVLQDNTSSSTFFLSLVMV